MFDSSDARWGEDPRDSYDADPRDRDADDGRSPLGDAEPREPRRRWTTGRLRRGVGMTLPPPPRAWNIDALTVERTQAVAAFGFTERQARFLVTVMLHRGVFVERQYCACAGIVH